jgi:hypothetical protein
MANIFTPSLPANGPWYIDREDCIGDSLSYINANTNYLAARIENLNSSVDTRVNTISSSITNIKSALKIAQGEYSFTAATQTTTINLEASGFNPSGPLPFIMVSIIDTNNSGQGGFTADRVILNVTNVTSTSFVLFGGTSTLPSNQLDAAPKVRWLAIQNNLPFI